MPQTLGNQQTRRKTKYDTSPANELKARVMSVKTPKKKEKKSIQSKLGYKNIVKSDFVNMGDYAISIGTHGYGDSWYEQNGMAMEKLNFMPNLKEMIEYYKTIMDSYYLHKELFDIEGNAIKRSTAIELYRELLSGDSFNINSFFKKEAGVSWFYYEACGIDQNKNVSIYKQIQEPELTLPSYYDVNELTETGLPSKMSQDNSFNRGENIFVDKINDNCVARLASISSINRIIFDNQREYGKIHVGFKEVFKTEIPRKTITTAT
jgi:hypothetical protein